MELITAAGTDFEALEAFYQRVCKPMAKGRDHAQWAYGIYPTRQDLQHYVKGGQFLILKEGSQIKAALAWTFDEQPGYENVDWKLKTGRICTFHLVAVDPDWQSQGLGKILLEKALEFLKPDAVHIDCVKENVRGAAFYRRCGFLDHGLSLVYYPDTGEIDYRMLEWIKE